MAQKRPGGTCQPFDRDARPIFGFEIWPNPIFLGWQIFSYFSMFPKISTIFLGLTNFQLFFGLPITHLNHLNEEHMVLKNIKS